MKKLYWILISIVISFNISCSSSDSDDEIESQIFLSENTFNDISINGKKINVIVNSEQGWTAQSNSSWCTVSPANSNEATSKLVITVAQNTSTDARSAIVTVKSSLGSERIKINQNGIGPDNIGKYRYKMNVIFHVLYQDSQDPLQYVNADRIKTILANANNLFTNSTVGSEINVEFAMAQKDPDGNNMSTPGIEYINMGSDYPINESIFMNDISGKYYPIIWDPNLYINIMLYNFKQTSSNSVTLGIAHLPFTTYGENYLEGLEGVLFNYISLENLLFPLCLSINSLYIDEDSTSSYNSYDVNVTLAHELGHYLGLLHTFSQDISNPCQDVDYCDDTPYYNRYLYDANLREYINNNDVENLKFENLVKRISCDGEQYESHNFMDYAISYADQFTSEQAQRMRHVMEYSPLIPGPKRTSIADKRAIEKEGKLDLPFRSIHCGPHIK